MDLKDYPVPQSATMEYNVEVVQANVNAVCPNGVSFHFTQVLGQRAFPDRPILCTKLSVPTSEKQLKTTLEHLIAAGREINKALQQYWG